MNLVEKNMNYPFKDLNEIMLKFMLKQKSKFVSMLKKDFSNESCVEKLKTSLQRFVRLRVLIRELHEPYIHMK